MHQDFLENVNFMKKITLILFLWISFLNTSFAEKITFENCNSDIPDSQNILGKKLPFWMLIIETNALAGAELRRYEGVSDGWSEWKTQIALLKPNKNKMFGYGIGRLSFIYEYEFDLDKSSFIVRELTSSPDTKTYERIMKAIKNYQETFGSFPELNSTLNTIMTYSDDASLKYIVTCDKLVE